LVTTILARIARKRGRDSWPVTAAAVGMLASHPWPGNIRQLENVLERATAFAEAAQLDERDIVPLLEGHYRTPAPDNTPGSSLQEVERQAFLAAYQRSGRNKARTARDLGIAERTVYNLLARYDAK
jgi:DNA-binding NtrC family response regulator